MPAAVNALFLESILTADVVTCDAATALGEVLRSMERERISCIVVVDAERRPCGIFTERDAVALLAEGAIVPAIPVAEVMSSPVVTLPASVDYHVRTCTCWSMACAIWLRWMAKAAWRV